MEYLTCEKCGKKIPKGSQNSTIGYQLGEVWCNDCADADYEACDTKEAEEVWPFKSKSEHKRRWKP